MPRLAKATLPNAFVTAQQAVILGTCSLTALHADADGARKCLRIPAALEQVNVTGYQDLSTLATMVQSLVIDNYACNSRHMVPELNLGKFVQLRSVVIGSMACRHVKSLVVNNMPNLEMVVIGCCSFTHTPTQQHFQECVFHCNNNPKLKTIRVGNYSFPSFYYFEAKCSDAMNASSIDNPELTEVEIGAETLDLAGTVHEEVEQGAFFRSGFAIESG